MTAHHLFSRRHIRSLRSALWRGRIVRSTGEEERNRVAGCAGGHSRPHVSSVTRSVAVDAATKSTSLRSSLGGGTVWNPLIPQHPAASLSVRNMPSQHAVEVRGRGDCRETRRGEGEVEAHNRGAAQTGKGGTQETRAHAATAGAGVGGASGEHAVIATAASAGGRTAAAAARIPAVAAADATRGGNLKLSASALRAPDGFAPEDIAACNIPTLPPAITQPLLNSSPPPSSPLPPHLPPILLSAAHRLRLYRHLGHLSPAALPALMLMQAQGEGQGKAQGHAWDGARTGNSDGGSKDGSTSRHSAGGGRHTGREEWPRVQQHEHEHEQGQGQGQQGVERHGMTTRARSRSHAVAAPTEAGRRQARGAATEAAGGGAGTAGSKEDGSIGRTNATGAAAAAAECSPSEALPSPRAPPLPPLPLTPTGTTADQTPQVTPATDLSLDNDDFLGSSVALPASQSVTDGTSAVDAALAAATAAAEASDLAGGPARGVGVNGTIGRAAASSSGTLDTDMAADAAVARRSGTVVPPSLRKAAVLVALFEGRQGELRVWLTRRASKLSTHAGEVALPGGKRDECDRSATDTALREAEEEVGLPRAAVRVVTHLEPFLSKHMLTVTPVVAVLPPEAASSFVPRANQSEVDAVFSVPLALFLQPDHHRCEDRSWLGLPYRVHFFHYCQREGEGEGEGTGELALAATGTGTVVTSTGIARSSSGPMNHPGVLPSLSPGGHLAGSEGGEVVPVPRGEGEGEGEGGCEGAEFVIWGLTASILVRVACVVYGSRAPFGEFHPEAPNYPTVLADLAKRRLFL